MKKTIFALLILMGLFGCNKADKNCYDKKMEENHSGICPQDCPGVCGCDGKTYCNECEAGRKGIRVVKNEPCK